LIKNGKLEKRKCELKPRLRKKKHLAEAAAQGEKIRAQRKEKEAELARHQEQKEQEEEAKRQRLRDEAKKDAETVQQTVDLDIQRTIMKEYESNFDNFANGSPSSDFGF